MVFGERKHFEEVLQSVKRAKLPHARKRSQIKKVVQLIRARTEELDHINPAWDGRLEESRDPNTLSRELLRLANSLPRDDCLPGRVLTQHKGAPGELLERMATNPYAAIRENVAWHPNAPAAVLLWLAEDTCEPPWFWWPSIRRLLPICASSRGAHEGFILTVSISRTGL